MKFWLGLSALACLSVVYANGLHAKKTSVNGIGWYNSMTDAEAASKASGKPILFLSMFGRLDEAMPCANARTLRATLFKDPQFKDLVTKDVIPAWEMVRPVPKVEIDFGDGRKMVRTVRGNACMYLCNADGKVMDAYPGVYTAADFLPMVRQALKSLMPANDAEAIAWHESLTRIPKSIPGTLSKMGVESPALLFINAQPTLGVVSPLTSQDPKIARFERAAAAMADMSLNPRTPDQVSMIALGHPIAGGDPAEVGRLILQKDSQQNATQVRNIIHLWLASEKTLPTTDQARDTVLERILKIPYKDPYFGLKQISEPGTP